MSAISRDQSCQAMMDKAYRLMREHAEKTRHEKQQVVIEDVINLMRTYSITIRDLHVACKARGVRLTENHLYRDPATGKTWRGVGRKPNWLKLASQDDASLESFRI